MRYYVPDLRLPEEAGGKRGLLDSLLGRKAEFREKLGGLPFGLPADRWPRCAGCGKLQSLLIQARHHPERLDLGREGRVLFVFMCEHDPGQCESWDAHGGANAAFVVEPETLTNRAPVPQDGDTLEENEALIVGWVAHDLDLTEAQARAFESDDAFLDLDQEIVDRATYSTRFGGVPHWLQSADDWPEGGWRFIGQLDNSMAFLTPPANPPAWVHSDGKTFEGASHFGDGPNFGDSGIAYLFLKDEGAPPPRALMLWQCL